MLKQSLFITSFITLLIVGILHIIATEFYLYWTFPWFDNLMHFLGGLWFGITSIWFFFFSLFAGKFKQQLSVRSMLTISIASVIVIGILWEFFEVYAGVLAFEPDYSLDTSTDLLMDTLGAVVAASYAILRFQRD